MISSGKISDFSFLIIYLVQVELVILPRSIINENPPDQQNQQPPPPPPPPQNEDSGEEQNEEENQEVTDLWRQLYLGSLWCLAVINWIFPCYTIDVLPTQRWKKVLYNSWLSFYLLFWWVEFENKYSFAYDVTFLFVIRMKMIRKMNNRNKYLKSLSLMQKVVWWMRNFSSLHNKHRDDVGGPGEQRMLYFLRIEDDILSPCFQRLACLPLILSAFSVFPPQDKQNVL